MQCSKCGTDDRESRRFCAKCGAPLGLACPECNFANEPHEDFCGGCGKRTDVSRIDYAKYSVAELLDIRRRIDPAVAPANFARLTAEMERRKDEIDAYTKKREQTHEAETAKRVVLLGWFQLAAFAFLVIYFLINLVTAPGEILTVLAVSAWVIAIALNGFAGFLSIQKKVLGYYLSLVNQLLQVISVAGGTFFYNYSGIGGIYIYYREGGVGFEGVGFEALFNPGFRIVWGLAVDASLVAIDLLAIFFIVVLLSAIEFARRKHLNGAKE